MMAVSYLRTPIFLERNFLCVIVTKKIPGFESADPDEKIRAL